MVRCCATTVAFDLDENIRAIPTPFGPLHRHVLFFLLPLETRLASLLPRTSLDCDRLASISSVFMWTGHM